VPNDAAGQGAAGPATPVRKPDAFGYNVSSLILAVSTPAEVRVDTWKEFDQNVVSHSAAHHLMAVDDLVQKLGYARVSDVARRLNITRGSVSISLQPLKKAGLVLQDENRHLRLSESGQILVDAIKAKRRLAQRLFAEVLGVTPEQAEIDACKMEHLVSTDTARRLGSFLSFLEANPSVGQKLLAAWREYGRNNEHDADSCPICKAERIADSITP
jgi:DtxR family Mn-dependent transcriptional regulator